MRAMTTVVSATDDPTERSIPPDTMTIVMPAAAMPTTTVCRAIVTRLMGRANVSGRSATNKRYTRRSATSGPTHEAPPLARAVARRAQLGRSRGHEPVASRSTPCSVSSRVGRAGPSRPRRITAMRSHTPRSSGK